MKLRFSIIPVMKRLKYKMFGLTPLLLIVIVVIYITAREFVALATVVLISISYAASMKEWKFMRIGVEYLLVDNHRINFKKFQYTEKEISADLSEIQIEGIKKSEALFRYKNKRYWLNKRVLVEGDWEKVTAVLSKYI